VGRLRLPRHDDAWRADQDGRDSVNELSYLFLDAETDVRLLNDEFVIRVHRNTPDAFIMKAARWPRHCEESSSS